ncbi:MAG: hypothetical protein R8K46_09115 [Mariprofundaceae bacterium]
MDEIGQQLKSLKQAWLAVPTVPDTLACIGLADISRQDVADTLDALSLLAMHLAKEKNGNLYAVTHYACASALKSAHAYLDQPIAQDLAVPLLGFVTLLQRIKVTLTDAMSQSNRATSIMMARQMAAQLTSQRQALQWSKLGPDWRKQNKQDETQQKEPATCDHASCG